MWIIFYVWYTFNAIFIRGIFNIRPFYPVFIVPITSLSLYGIFAFQNPDYKYDLVVFFLKWLMISVVIESLIGISQSFFSFPFFPQILNNLVVTNRNYFAFLFSSLLPQVTQGSGTFSHPNGLGGLLSLTFPIFFGYWYSNKRKKSRIFLLIITFLGLFTTYSRGALIGVMFTSSFFFLFFSNFSKRIKVSVALLIIFLFAVFLSNDIENYYMSTQNFTIRLDIWGIVLNYVTNNPFKILVGYGIFFFRDNVLGFGGIPKDVHSGQLEILIELGIIGFVLFCKFYFQIISQALKFRNNFLILSLSAGLMSFFVHQLVENQFFGYLGILTACLLGVLISVMKDENEEILKWWLGTD